jgi:PD-(D/E)XK nuclease superfamily protein
VVLTTDQKGNIAEHAVLFEATRLGIDVYRPAGEGGRYDMLFELGEQFVRVQCKWAPRNGDVIMVRCYSSRRNRHGLVRRVYAVAEIDAFAAYCPDTERCYFLPYALFGERRQINLRVRRPRNNQRQKVNWAKDFEFAARLGRSRGAIAQLGERQRGTLEVAGSSPAGSTPLPDLFGPWQAEQIGNPDQCVLQVAEPEHTQL